jgi:Bacterial regulatory helix-turn-helix protein, lysR family
MELRLLRYFVAIGEELHFGRAARRLRIEQSPLSRAIKKPEEELGSPLLERRTRAARSTWLGRVVAFVHASVISIFRYAHVITRPLSAAPLTCTTYLLRSCHEPSPQLQRFIARAQIAACVQEASAG